MARPVTRDVKGFTTLGILIDPKLKKAFRLQTEKNDENATTAITRYITNYVANKGDGNEKSTHGTVQSAK